MNGELRMYGKITSTLGKILVLDTATTGQVYFYDDLVYGDGTAGVVEAITIDGSVDAKVELSRALKNTNTGVGAHGISVVNAAMVNTLILAPARIVLGNTANNAINGGAGTSIKAQLGSSTNAAAPLGGGVVDTLNNAIVLPLVNATNILSNAAVV